jgi:hypothetical protein
MKIIRAGNNLKCEEVRPSEDMQTFYMVEDLKSM